MLEKFKPSEETKKFWKAACIRAARTALQVFIGAVGTASLWQDVNWGVVASTVAISTVVSLANAVLTGLPEA